MNRRNASASRLLLAAVAALSVFLLFCGPIADCCPLALTASAQTEHACCLASEQTTSKAVTMATAGAIRDRAEVVSWRTPEIGEDGVSYTGRRADPLPVLSLPPARAVLTVRLRI